MNVYFVRHGLTKGNELMLHQNSESELSEVGLKQAEILAQRFEKIKIDLIITSPFIRAKNTAEIINTKLNKPIQESDLFVELKRPTEVENLKVDDKKVLEIKELIKKNYHIKSYKYSDEETFYEFKNRAEKALKYLENKSFNNILVVTHGAILRCIFGIIVFGNKFDSESLIKLNETIKSYNTGITFCKYNNSWEVITWNDISHLG